MLVDAVAFPTDAQFAPGDQAVLSGIPVTKLPESINVEVEFVLTTVTLKPLEFEVFTDRMLVVATNVPGEIAGRFSEPESVMNVNDPPADATVACG